MLCALIILGIFVLNIPLPPVFFSERFLVLRNIRSTLLRFDAASKRISASHRSSKNSDRTGSNRSNITEPLLVDEEKGGVEDGDY